MKSKKQNDPSTSCSTPSTRTATSDSKLAASTEKLDIEDKDEGKDGGGEDLEDEVADLDSVLTGGCSTCGSDDHDEVDCEVEPDPMYMMTTALQPATSDSQPSSTTSTTSTTSTDKSGRGGQGGSKKIRSK